MRLRAPLTALALASVLASIAHAENPKAGKWSQETSISLDGQHWLPWPARQSCLTDAQAQQSIEQMLQQAVSQAVQSGCRAVNVQAAEGKAHGRFVCSQPSGEASVDADGTYASDRYELTLTGTNIADRSGSGLVVPKLFLKHVGRNVGACAG